MKIYGVDRFSLEDVIQTVHSTTEAALNEKSQSQILKSKSNVESIVNSEMTVYGINTGLGDFGIPKFPKKKPENSNEIC